MVAEGKETREFNGRPYVLEHALKADFALDQGVEGRSLGQSGLSQDGAQLQSHDGDRGSKITIAEVEHLVEPGEIDPDQVHTPSVYVKRIIQGTDYEKRIERRTVRKA